jgi:hypothetical protein
MCRGVAEEVQRRRSEIMKTARRMAAMNSKGLISKGAEVPSLRRYEVS